MNERMGEERGGSRRRAGPAGPLAAVTTALALAASAAGDPRTTADGVFTAEQARQGLEVHRQHCAKCHDRGYFQGPFLAPWQQVPVATLYDVIELKMPEDSPGSLTPAEYTALLAYVFDLNGLPAGDDRLPDDHEALEHILIEGGG